MSQNNNNEEVINGAKMYESGTDIKCDEVLNMVKDEVFSSRRSSQSDDSGCQKNVDSQLFSVISAMDTGENLKNGHSLFGEECASPQDPKYTEFVTAFPKSGKIVNVFESPFQVSYIYIDEVDYAYLQKKIREDGTLLLRCFKKLCPGSGIYNPEDRTIERAVAHYHNPCTYEMYKLKFFHMMKLRSEKEITYFNEIYKDECAKFASAILPSYESLKRILKEKRPSLPESPQTGGDVSFKSQDGDKESSARFKMDIIEGKRRFSQIYVDELSYCYLSYRRDEARGVYVRCYNAGCKSAGLFVIAESVFIMKCKHNHSADPLAVKRMRFSHQCKLRAEREATPLKDIYDTEAEKFPDINLPSFDKMSSNLVKRRRQKRLSDAVESEVSELEKVFAMEDCDNEAKSCSSEDNYNSEERGLHLARSHIRGLFNFPEFSAKMNEACAGNFHPEVQIKEEIPDHCNEEKEPAIENFASPELKNRYGDAAMQSSFPEHSQNISQSSELPEDSTASAPRLLKALQAGMPDKIDGNHAGDNNEEPNCATSEGNEDVSKTIAKIAQRFTSSGRPIRASQSRVPYYVDDDFDFGSSKKRPRKVNTYDEASVKKPFSVKSKANLCKMSVIEGHRRFSKLFIDEYSFIYRLNKIREDGGLILRCYTKRCPVSGSYSQSEELFQRNHEHNHPSLPNVVARCTFLHNLKTRAEIEERPLREIYDEEAVKYSSVDIPPFNNIESTLQRRRRAKVPSEPQTIAEAAMQFDRTDFCKSSRGNFFRKYSIVDGCEMLVFLSPGFMEEKMSQGDTFHVDSSFRILPHGLTRLIIVHLVQDEHLFPVAYSLFSKKSYLCLVDFFHFLKEETAGFWPKFVTYDFSAEVRNALLQVFPNVIISGCWFYYSQVIWRQMSILGLSDHFFSDEGVRSMIEFIISLPLLPSAFVHAGLAFMQDKIMLFCQGNMADLLNPLTDLLRFYEERVEQYCVDTLCAFGLQSKLNYEIQNFYFSYVKRLGGDRPLMIKFTEKLLQIDKLATDEFAQLSSGLSIRGGRRKINATEKLISNSYIKLQANEITVESFLLTVSAFVPRHCLIDDSAYDDPDDSTISDNLEESYMEGTSYLSTDMSHGSSQIHAAHNHSQMSYQEDNIDMEGEPFLPLETTLTTE